MKDMFKGVRIDNSEEVEGWYVYFEALGVHIIISKKIKKLVNNCEKESDEVEEIEVIPESVKINLNGKWVLLKELDKPCEWNNLNHTTSCGNIYPHRITDFRLTCCTYCGKKIKEV